MKVKVIVLFLCIVFSSLAYSQDGYNSNQIRFRNDINQFLKEEGYSPSINSGTGDINFKMEGTNYVVDLDTDYKGSYLVTLSATFNMESMSYTDKQKLYEVENTINSRYDCVKASYMEYEDTRLLIFSIESFCHNSDDFKYALVKYLGFIKSAIGDFRELYSGSDKSYESSTRQISSPYYSSTSKNKGLKIAGVDLTPTETRVYFTYDNSYSSSGWVQIDPKTYIVANGTKYTMTKAEAIPLAPKKHNFTSQYEKLSFTLVFPAIPISTKQIDLIESQSSEWKFYGITL